MNNKKRWSRVAVAILGVLMGLAALPVDSLGWVRFLAGLGFVGISAYWSNSDKLLGDRNEKS